MKIGDIVCRKKYGKDICFKITDIQDDVYYLTGIEYRLVADSDESDLIFNYIFFHKIAMNIDIKFFIFFQTHVKIMFII